MTNLSDVVQDERTARMVLSLIVEPDDAVTGRLLGELGALELLRLAERDGVVPGLSNVDAQVWRSQFERSDARTLEQNVVEAERAGIGALIPGDKEWPSALDDLGDRRPYVLWTRGTTSFLAPPLSDFVTITGARASTSYGDHVAGQLASDLANAERLVVAGGAYGIEGAAHRAALASGGDTIAVMANGVDRTYPMGHRELLERVADLGLLVSEVPPGAVPTRHRFIARARLMAGLSATTVVVEAGVRSGSMTVARRAHELGRTVGAVPGPVTSAASVGANRLIHDRIASLVSDSSDSSDLAGLAEPGRTPQVKLGREHDRPTASATRTL
ncbi:DNA-processing protein DprA [Microbacterium maritypicum]|uniref:DNA-protecting protein DprA n=1 Tax=Microbacterium maritypicum TaxID=33918 RepID=A0AAJ5V997_MICMQ|nr:DNA-processing protein DprA [Microbacterium liquefaciens]WEF20071.1 DNA-protecting protein DprA [Microbacterium liquefaciens]